MKARCGAVLIFVLLGVAAAGQPTNCESFCMATFEAQSLGIPLGAVYAAAQALACLLNPAACKATAASIAAGALIPSLEIRLNTTTTVTQLAASCPDGCCPEGNLYARPNVTISGDATVPGLVESRVSVMGAVTAEGHTIRDQSVTDGNPAPCRVATREEMRIPVSDFRVSLVFLDNFHFEVHREGVALGSLSVAVRGVGCSVSLGCGPITNRPPHLVVPETIDVPIGRVTALPLGATDPDEDPVQIWVQPLQWEGASIHYDAGSRGYVISVDSGYSGRQLVAFPVFGYDLRPGVVCEGGHRPQSGQYFHEIQQVIAVRITHNQPPVAIGSTVVVRHMDLVRDHPASVLLPLRAEDPDLPGDNWGYGHVFIWNTPFLRPSGWECACPRWEPAPLFTTAACCSGPREGPAYALGCLPTNLEHVIVTATRGAMWSGSFAVLEVHRTTLQRGYSSTASVALVVNNQPPSVGVSPDRLTAQPGDPLQAAVTATDLDGDPIKLVQLSGPGSLVVVHGVGYAQGTWTWTVPSWYAYGPSWEIATFRADDGWGGRGYGTLVIRILRPLRVHGSAVAVSRGGTALGSVYVDDGDPSPIRPDFPPVTLAFQPPPGISVVERREIQPSGLGAYIPLEVQVARDLCPGTHSVRFTVRHLDGRTASGTLAVVVVGNRPPVASPPVLRGETRMVLTPAGPQRTPLVFSPIQVWDPEGDPVFIEGYGVPPTYAASLSAFLGSLVALYTPGGLTEEDLCAAAVHNDALVDTFSLTLRDACGATTEVPVKVFLRVEDRIPPKIVYPAQSKTVECDGQGNVGEFQAWLAGKGGAWAFDNCPCAVSWAHRIERHEPGCRGTGTYGVTFTAGAGHRSSSGSAVGLVDLSREEA